MREKNLNKKPDGLFSELISFIADPAVVLDNNGVIWYANQATEKYTGVKVEELIGSRLFDFFDISQALLFNENLKKRFMGERIPLYEVKLKSKQGTVSLLEVNAKRCELGDLVLDVVVFRDVTERVQRREELEHNLNKSELQFKTISDSTLDGIILFDQQEKIRYWNASAQRLFGYKANEVLGKALRETIVPSHAFGLLDKYTEEFLKDQNIIKKAIEFPVQRKNGEEFPAEVTISQITLGNEDLAVAVVRDISERKDYEYAWRQQHEMLEAVTENTGVGLSLITPDYRIFWTNHPMKQIFGGSIQGKKCFTRLGKQAVCSDCSLKKIFDEGENLFSHEVSGFDKEGNAFTLQVTASPVRDKNGKIFAALEVAVPITRRKQMEKQIDEAKNLYHALFEQTPLGVLVIDPETTRIIEFNDVAHRQLGYTREEFSKLDISDFEALESSAGIEQVIKKVLNEGSVEFLTKHRTKNGETINILVNQRKIELPGRDIILATCHDVTGINRMHDALRSSEEKFYGIANCVKDALILINDDSKVIYWNPAAEKTFGYTSKEAIGRGIHQLVIPDSVCKEGIDRIGQSMNTFRETGMGYFTVGKVEVTGRRKDGTEFPAELAVSPLNINGKWNAVGVVKDVTSRKLSDQKLRDAEQRYHSLFNQSPLGVLVIDPEATTCIEFNDVAHQQLGYTREEFEKIRIFEIEAHESPQEVKAHIWQMVESGGGEFETQHLTKSGEIRNVIVTTRVLQAAGKKYLHAIFHDITEIRKVQTALMVSEARYRQLVELAHEGIWAVDNDFVTFFVNPRMAQMLGYMESEMVGKPFFDFLGSDKVETVKDAIQEYRMAGRKGQFEIAFPTKDGQTVETTMSLSTLTDDHKQVIGVLAVISDITERKQADRALTESEERFRAISTSAMDAIILSDLDDKVIYWNPAAERAFGYSAEETLGKKLADLVIPPRAHKKHQRLLEELIFKPTSQRQSGLTAQRKDGSSFPIDLSVVSVKLKDKNCLLSTIRDITESMAMEEALRQERDLLESVTSSTNMVLFIVNRNYEVIWTNQRAKQAAHSDNLLDKPCYESFGQGSKGICEGCGVRKIFENDESIVRRDYLRKTSAGKDLWLELISTPIKDKEGNVISALEIAIDINERKQLQNKLAEYSQRLEEIVQKRTEQLKRAQAELVKSERLAAIGELAGMIGHDLRNPLTGIKNSAYFLKKKGTAVDPKQAQEMLENIDKCVNYSNKIVSDLLDYSREIHLYLEEESPKKLLSDALAMMEIPQRVTVKNKLSESPCIIVDPDKMKRVIINLVKNAVDAMPNGGEVTVDSRQVKGGLEISFHDTGCGVSDEILPRLFSPLFTTKAQGMGFGLAICKRVVEAHGGTIAVSTIKDHGTTFTITLPLRPKLESGGENVWINIPESSLSTTTKP
ncbi:MAG: PAS domain S-box protein [Candidatus Bathyarchaeota archaeon]|nr:PAS domain S-box protein [Candidatus Bathyarchaeota archaeon]